MKRLAVCLLGICLCAPAYAQWGKLFRWGKGASNSAVKGAELAARVQAQAAKSSFLSASQVRRMVATERFSAQLVPSILVSKEAPKLVRNEFLTLSARKNIRISAEESVSALSLLRRNLLARTGMLDNSSRSVSAPLDPSGQAATLALEALADAYGVGWYGSQQDGPSLVKLYQTLANSELEPVAFTAAARGLLALEDYKNLEFLLFCARRTQAYESFARFLEDGKYPVNVPVKPGEVLETSVSAYKEPMYGISVPGVSLFDFSAKATFQYMMTASRLRALRELAGVSVPQPSAKPAVPSLERALAGVETGIEPSSLALDATALPAGASAPAAEEPAVPTFGEMPRVNPITKRFPSGLQDEQQVIADWMEYYRNGYFRPRDQIEAIRGMSAKKANNLTEYLYYMPLEEAERVILDPIRQTGRLPDFMYNAKLMPGTRRLPAGYYKNKFNENIKRFVELAEEDGSIFLHNVELKELATALEDYTFAQGFSYANDPVMSAALRRNWRALVEEIGRPGFRADRSLVNELWRRPVNIGNGKTVSLSEYFTQTRRSAFFENGSMPEFFLNSPKWVALENERRNLAAAEYINRFGPQKRSLWERVQDFFILGNRNNYLTVEQFGNVMLEEYKKTFDPGVFAPATSLAEVDFSMPSSTEVRINNFDKVGGVCQMSFSDGGYAGPVRAGYDGTSTVHRFEPVNFERVNVVAFDFETMSPRVMTLASVPYVKDIKKPNVDQLRAGTMVGDGLDPTRDLLGVQQAEASLHKIPHLKATIYPRARLAGWETLPPFLDGGGLGAYLALFTPDFYPLKKINRWRWVNGKLTFVPEYFVRKEVPALAGAIHRDHLTFTGQIEDRVVKE